MKKTISIILTLSTLIIILFSGCASKEKPVRVRDENFVADVPYFKVGVVHLYSSFSLNKPKVHDFQVTFYPRSNYLYITGRIGADIVDIGFSYNERKSLAQAKDAYLEAFKKGQLKKEKPTKKNAFSSGTVRFFWGTFAANNETVAKYYTNVQYILDDKPYFRILFEQTKELEDPDKTSPRMNFYISPAQWEQIMEMCNQEVLEARTDEIVAQADAFELEDPGFDTDVPSDENSETDYKPEWF